MKVLFIHCAYRYKGGEDTVVAEEIKLLANAGVEVQLLLFSNEKNTLAGIVQFPFNFGAYRKTRSKLRAFCPDVVHVHNLHFAASPSVIYAVKKHGVPMVCTLHNFRLLCPSATLFYNGKLFLHSLRQKFPLEAVQKGVFKNSRLLTFWLAFSMQLHRMLGTWRIPQKMIVLSRHAELLFQQAKMGVQKEQLVIKPNFCARPANEVAERTDAFLYIGRLSPEKGIPLLLQAFEGSLCHLVIAGDGPLQNDVMNSAAKHANIRYLGPVDKEEVHRLMRQATALVFPSVWFEGMPLTIIEAFACGTPVLASEMGAMASMINPGYNGLFFEAANRQSLRMALDTWRQLPAAEKERFSAQALATYETLYTPEKNKAQLLAIYATAQAQALPARPVATPPAKATPSVLNAS